MKRATLIFFVIAIALIVRGTAHAAMARVTLVSRADVRPAMPVAIKDIARIEGPKEPARRIGEVTVATGPMPGKHATLDARFVRLRLQAEIEGKVEVRGAERIEIAGKCLRFSPEQLAGRAREFLLDQLPKDNRTYEVVIDRFPREIVVASGAESELRPRLLNPTLRPGPLAVAVDVAVDQRVVANGSVSLTVKAMADVLVATTNIRPCDTLSPDNTAWDRREVTRKPDAVTQATGDTMGWIVRRPVAAGVLITANDIAAPYTVRRGENVAVTVTCGGITLRTSGEVRQDARTGDLVRVRPVTSNEDVQAKVLGPGSVGIAR